MSNALKLADNERSLAFGEALGLEIPTRYSEQIHSALDVLFAADSLLTPAILRMSGRTVLFCRLLAGGLMLLRDDRTGLPLRRRLEWEAIIGLLVLVMAVRGTVSRRGLDRAYLFIGGVMMVGNSLMTEVE